MEYTIDDAYSTKSGHCIVQAANVGAVLDLINIDHYWMAGFSYTNMSKIGWTGHDFIYVPEYDCILSNGRIENLSDTVLDHIDDKNKKGPFQYIHFIDFKGKYASKITLSYSGSLSPIETLEILSHLRSIHGDNLQGGHILKDKLISVPHEELVKILQNE